jgi:hypothetical protein
LNTQETVLYQEGVDFVTAKARAHEVLKAVAKEREQESPVKKVTNVASDNFSSNRSAKNSMTSQSKKLE